MKIVGTMRSLDATRGAVRAEGVYDTDIDDLWGERLHFHGAGWQAHLEDLARSLGGEAAAGPEPWTEQKPEPTWRARWAELTPAYERAGIN